LTARTAIDLRAPLPGDGSEHVGAGMDEDDDLIGDHPELDFLRMNEGLMRSMDDILTLTGHPEAESARGLAEREMDD
jgi:hypothetical protein